ncbi:hypothetical protein KOM00_02010 [Geomonas sp. Red69]|uniref:hypothetical protein n=1 Tax=Geomonas diazotrophica TaxID=2843197 RepID=UPI001C0F6A06|nr:hypothetical protein [Geomonas diazotrophica]MBU5635501.1 hypothetical protein [Geomonas diazotrophica]
MTTVEMKEAIDSVAQLVKTLDWTKRVHVLDHMASLLDKDGFLDAHPVLKAEITSCRRRMLEKALKEAA